MCVCVCVRGCVCVCGCTSLNRLHERPALSVAWDLIHGQLFKTFSTPLFDNIRIKEASQKSVRFFSLFFLLLLPFKHILKALFVGIPKVQEQAFSDDRNGTMVVHGW